MASPYGQQASPILNDENPWIGQQPQPELGVVPSSGIQSSPYVDASEIAYATFHGQTEGERDGIPGTWNNRQIRAINVQSPFDSVSQASTDESHKFLKPNSPTSVDEIQGTFFRISLESPDSPAQLSDDAVMIEHPPVTGDFSNWQREGRRRRITNEQVLRQVVKCQNDTVELARQLSTGTAQVRFSNLSCNLDQRLIKLMDQWWQGSKNQERRRLFVAKLEAIRVEIRDMANGDVDIHDTCMRHLLECVDAVEEKIDYFIENPCEVSTNAVIGIWNGSNAVVQLFGRIRRGEFGSASQPFHVESRLVKEDSDTIIIDESSETAEGDWNIV
jgi:hypothetical protein